MTAARDVGSALAPRALGAAAPDFALRNQHGETVTRDSLLGSPTLLVFYPYAFSRVCGSELHALSDSIADFAPADVVAISVDPLFALRAYYEMVGMAFPLLSDFWPHGEVSQAFGIFDAERGVACRSTFLLDSDGVIRWSVHNPDHLARRPADYLAAIRAL